MTKQLIAGERCRIIEGYPPKVHHKARTIIAKAGDEVLIIAVHMDVLIVESAKKERFSIHKSYLK